MSASIPIVLQPRLVIQGVDEAVAFYEDVLGAELVERFAGPDGVVVHAAMRFGSSIVTMTEHAPDWKLAAPRKAEPPSVLLHLTLPDPDGAFARFVERGGQVVIPIGDRFYGKREGRVRDPFGHLWILSRPIEKLDHAEIQQRLDAS